ncbi:dTDP-4-dehydrorhamnose reductase [Clostridium tagluense]|uniref:dTDP-4-dehydrorhamnose reductase n=1 Tax=Clostridium tagluense TaxID=360422 RepID=UPI001C0DAD9A|nr:dTDP-4-dehydrorhamnose reductase [Clostridium tagluense]MBU3126864.1 dTDP-4-dehydrorhamnose reductase [Clostridium tagluense]MCB2310538.1 dTDP-4-dehydrorhamnose reductase [Clostridium tagluense]MCB2315296.1 dTDP-4-dehydrorhamnose reductase [Clostridium tagluense]MCB2320147.1 dTDP-4-dehydrorhamnose reductase [Clostridium tagluense]MCB2325038.1 dTDP-4-dehydrorhamnose reductase [Clostridium tagluense]
MKILITGANGQLGTELANQYKNIKGIDLILAGKSDLDITNLHSVYNFVNQKKPDVIINCAAFTAVDTCESQIDMAYKINAIGPKNLAIAANEIGAEIVQVSTDYVFDGNTDKSLTEFDLVNPQTVYGKTKLEGEILVKSHNPKHYIVRTAWLYGEGNNFVRTMINLSKTNTTIKVVNDQKGTPTSTVDLARVIIKLIEDKNYGLFHCTCKGECTWYEFTKEIFRLKGISTEVLPCTTDEFKRPAKRPKYSVLRNYMMELTCGDITRTWEEAISEYLK